jgi:hypothetical protein
MAIKRFRGKDRYWNLSKRFLNYLHLFTIQFYIEWYSAEFSFTFQCRVIWILKKVQILKLQKNLKTEIHVWRLYFFQNVARSLLRIDGKGRKEKYRIERYRKKSRKKSNRKMSKEKTVLRVQGKESFRLLHFSLDIFLFCFRYFHIRCFPFLRFPPNPFVEHNQIIRSTPSFFSFFINKVFFRSTGPKIVVF